MAAPASDRSSSGRPRDVRVRVAAVLMQDGRLVLVRHRFGDNRYHLLPGGGVEPGETLAEALEREVAEETGLEARLVRPLFVSDTLDPGGRRHIVNLTFLAEVTGGALRAPEDPRVEAVDLVGPADLGSLDLRPPFAEELAAAAAEGFSGTARYLGSLWTEEPESA